MSQTWIITVGAARLGAADDPAGLLVARALLADGVPVVSRQIVDEDETAVEEALRGALEAASLVVVLSQPGGSSGEVVRRALSRLTGARLVLNDKLLALLEEDFASRGQAMPRRLDRLALLPQGALLWPGAGEPAWVLESKRAAVVVLPAGSAALGSLVDQQLRPLARQRAGAGESTVLRTLHTSGLAPADVTAIELGVAKPVLRTIAEPPEAKARPASGYHAAFSGPYTVAAALLGGGLGVSHEDFTDAAARDPRRLALAALVRCVEDERCSASFPHAFPAVLRVTTRTGEELEARVEVNRGGPGNPLSDEELARKFHDNAVRSLPEERAAELAARTLALPDAQSVEDLTALLTSAGER